MTVIRKPNLKLALTGRGGFIFFAPKSNPPSPSTSTPTLDEVPQPSETTPSNIDGNKESADAHSAIDTGLKGWLDRRRTEAATRFAKLFDERDASTERESYVDQKFMQPPTRSPDSSRPRPH